MDKEILEKLILKDNLSYNEIGRMFGISNTLVKKRAIKWGIKLKPRRKVNPSEYLHFSHRRIPDKICPTCGKEFRPRCSKQIFCSQRCSSLSPEHLLAVRKRLCKPKIEWDGVERKNMWPIEKVVDNHGYLYARCPQHPCATSTGYVYLHRLIVENHLGRLLKKDEAIHHIDGNKRNNSIENLQVVTPGQHSSIHAKERKEKGIVFKIKNPARGKRTKFGHFEESEIREIRKLAESKEMSCSKIAKKYGVTKSAIRFIIKRKTYAWVA